MASSKKGISAHQLHRTLKVTYKTAWFMEHRLREAMREGHFNMGGEGKTVEIDETYVGGLEKNKQRSKRKRLGTGARQGSGFLSSRALWQGSLSPCPAGHCKDAATHPQAQVDGATVVIRMRAARRKNWQRV